jgi:hypothetical protein
VVAALVGQVLCRCQGDTGRDDTFDCGIVGQVEEKHGPLQRAVLLEVLQAVDTASSGLTIAMMVSRPSPDDIMHGQQATWAFADLLEEVSSLHVHTHGCKHDGKLVVVLVLDHGVVVRALHKACLPADLGSNVVVGKTCSSGVGE